MIITFGQGGYCFKYSYYYKLKVASRNPGGFFYDTNSDK